MKVLQVSQLAEQVQCMSQGRAVKVPAKCSSKMLIMSRVRLCWHHVERRENYSGTPGGAYISNSGRFSELVTLGKSVECGSSEKSLLC